jgi:hypothetical protein
MGVPCIAHQDYLKWCYSHFFHSFFMTLSLRALRFSTSFPSRTFSASSRRLFQTSSFHSTPTSAACHTAPGTPKIMSQIPNLKLNDGKEIPVVSFPQLLSRNPSLITCSLAMVWELPITRAATPTRPLQSTKS